MKAIFPPHLGLQDKGDKIFIFHNSDEELVEEEGDQLVITRVKLRSLFFSLGFSIYRGIPIPYKVCLTCVSSKHCWSFSFSFFLRSRKTMQQYVQVVSK